MKKIPDVETFAERYSSLPLEPLAVTVTLKRAVILYDPVYLDNLLARCVLDMALRTSVIENTTEAYDLPTPLKRLWTSADGLPLWAASVFTPVGEDETDTVYLHKRLGRFEFSERQPKSNVGRWMDRRIPKQAHICKTWRSWCVGNRDEIAMLLENVRFIGKHRNIGYGEVAGWDIDPWEGSDLETIVQGERLLHAVPVEAAETLGVLPEGPTCLVGWTPPQWKTSLFSQGWRIGTAVP